MRWNKGLPLVGLGACGAALLVTGCEAECSDRLDCDSHTTTIMTTTGTTTDTGTTTGVGGGTSSGGGTGGGLTGGAGGGGGG